MAHIGTTDIYIGVESLPRGEFEEYSTHLFDQWDDFVSSSVNLPDYSPSLHIEEGSIKGRAKIAAALGALYFGIAQYGSFISGLNTIQKQIKMAGDYLGKKAVTPFSDSGVKPRVRNKGESLSQLKQLFKKVESGEISSEEAIIMANTIFGEELSQAPDFKDALEESLVKTQLAPIQESLIFVDAQGELLETPESFPQKPKKPLPREPLPITDAYRVEVWRESKKGKKNVKVIVL
ncbi:MAG: hypothetical protein ACI9J4_000440 [Paraglaciecola sp.]|jgi:hypothetical protein